MLAMTKLEFFRGLLLKKLTDEKKKTIIIVRHDERIVNIAARKYKIKDGRIRGRSVNRECCKKQQVKKLSKKKKERWN